MYYVDVDQGLNFLSDRRRAFRPLPLPSLTTVCAPIEEVGREAVYQLNRLMDGQQAQALTLMRTELVIQNYADVHPMNPIKRPMKCFHP